jgi:hypothetical protein
VVEVDNHGRTCFFYRNSNSKSRCIMLDKFANIIEKENRNWRSKTIKIIDVAPYHETEEVKKLLRDLEIPTLFSCPYSP